MLGDQAAAEDVVQDAFLGLYRRWGSLADPAAAQSYLRTTVLNGCRSALRRRARHGVRVRRLRCPRGRPGRTVAGVR